VLGVEFPDGWTATVPAAVTDVFGATIDIHRALVAGAGPAEVAHVLGVSVAEVACLG
jgi:hypothetical protein